MDRPNPIKVLRHVIGAIRQTTRPAPVGAGSADHSMFQPILDALADRGLPAVMPMSVELADYVAKLESIDPDTLSRDEALAYWINLYNAGAIQLATEAFGVGASSVLRIDGGFRRPFATVADEELSLAAIEHGKVRRFKDPRIHAALVCGSLSCPTLRREPFTGPELDDQLADQMAKFIGSGGATRGADGSVELSRIFFWYGADFVRPQRMPSFLPASRRRTLKSIERWLPADLRSARRIRFQDYDWGLACDVS